MISKSKVLTIVAVIVLAAAIPNSVAAGPAPVNSAAGRVGWWSASGEMWDVPGACHTTIKFRLYDYPRDAEGNVLGEAKGGSMTILVGSGAGRGDYRKYKFELFDMDIIDLLLTGELLARADMVCTSDTLYTGAEASRVGELMRFAATDEGYRKVDLSWGGVNGGIYGVQKGSWRFRISNDYATF